MLRHQLHKALLTALLLLLAASSQATPPPGFVYTSGINFYVNGTEFHFAGDNTYWLGLAWMGTPKSEVDSEMANYVSAGIKVVRIWAFSDGNIPGALQPSLGVYSEPALETLDYAVYDASRYGIKVILTLENYWTDFGGMTWYVQQVEGGTSPDVNHFYTNATCQTYYQQYINMLVNRTNTYSGVQYKNDPTIFSWECANEARDPEDTTGNTIYNWYSATTTYIRSLDPSHMITTGEEGFMNIPGSGPNYWNNGQAGTDFERNITLPNVTCAVVHMYPKSWHLKASDVTAYLSTRATTAQTTNNKPIILEEFGEPTPASIDFTTWTNQAEADNYNGIDPWQMVDELIDRTYDFLFSSSVGTVMKNVAAYQNTR